MISKGYTLIELLIVITVSVIVFSVGIAGYREFSRRQTLTGIVKITKADLRLAQQLALTGQKPEGQSCIKLDGYTFKLVGTTGYQLVANCVNPELVNYVTKTVDMPTSLSLTAVQNIMFKILGQGTNLSSPLTITIRNTAANISENIIVGIGGDIQ